MHRSVASLFPGPPGESAARLEAALTKSAIIALAAVCGLAVFFWSLFGGHRGSQRGFSGQRSGGAMAMADLPEDIPSLRAIVEQTPDRFTAWSELAAALADSGDEAGARQAWETAARAAERQASQSSGGRAYFTLVWAHRELGHDERARAYAAKAEALYTDPAIFDRRRDDPTFQYRLGWLYAIQGKDADARLAWQSAAKLLRETPPASLGKSRAYLLACVLALVGDKPAALEMLDQAYRLGYTNHARAARAEDFKSLGDDPRFDEILTMMQRTWILKEGG